MDDRRQKVEEGDASKGKSFSGNWGEMRKKVSLHQTQELPLLQTVPAQRLDETRCLTLNWSPTTLLGDCGCGCLHVFMQTGAWTVILRTEVTAASFVRIAYSATIQTYSVFCHYQGSSQVHGWLTYICQIRMSVGKPSLIGSLCCFTLPLTDNLRR